MLRLASSTPIRPHRDIAPRVQIMREYRGVSRRIVGSLGCIGVERHAYVSNQQVAYVGNANAIRARCLPTDADGVVHIRTKSLDHSKFASVDTLVVLSERKPWARASSMMRRVVASLWIRAFGSRSCCTRSSSRASHRTADGCRASATNAEQSHGSRARPKSTTNVNPETRLR